MKRKAKLKLIQPLSEKTLKFIPKIFVLSYVIFSLLTLTNCIKQHNNDNISYDQFVQRNQETAQQLIQQNNAELFDCKQIDFILNKSVIADSTIIGTFKRRGNYFLKALINNSCGKNIYTTLTCSEEVIERYNSIKSNHVFLAAKITKIEKLNFISEADSLDGKSTFIRGNNAVFLTGECLALAEIPIYSRQ
ncbi:MAG: hypothetical protein NTZ27_11065 [Ignavibacteriales bacterium]|nr:hypothetical protein [Ignavibacteriales bacterium]